MAIKNIVAKGIGFSPGTKKWIPTHGFTQGAAAVAISGFIVSGEAVRLPAFSGQRVQFAGVQR